MPVHIPEGIDCRPTRSVAVHGFLEVGLKDRLQHDLGGGLDDTIANGAVSLNASAGERALGSYHLQNANAYQSRFKLWMAPFKGVATKYLSSYVGWRRMIEREDERLTLRRAIAEALGA
jgi:hypothetical protein